MTQTPVQPKTHPQTTWAATEILDKLTATLPVATTDWQRDALAALNDGQYSRCKIYPCLALEDPFVKAIGYMSSIPTVIAKGVPTLPTLIGESCRAIAEACYLHALNTGTNEDEAHAAKQKAAGTLENLNQEIFVKGLGR
ncbi:MAG: hypothetical protein AAFO59_09735 [Cyanobacteria bacterium J06607_17]